MTDNEIIKSLELCGNIDVSCKGCVFVNCELCRVKLAENAYILINRQQAEIERLNEELKITRTYIHDNGLEWDLLSYSKRNGG